MVLTIEEATEIEQRYDAGIVEAWNGEDLEYEPEGFWWMDVVETLHPVRDGLSEPLYEAAESSEITTAALLGLPRGTPSAELRAALEAVDGMGVDDE